MTRRGFVLFALLSVGWGIPYLLIKIAVRELDPAMLVLARMGLAALVLVPIAGARGELMPVLRRWRPLLAFTVVEMVVPQFLLGSAEERLPSSTTGLLIAAVPLAGVGVAFLLGRPERLAPLNWLGIALGMAGVAALVGFAVSGSDLGAFGEVLVVVAGYALGPAILAKWMPDLSGAAVMALGFTVTAVAYAPVVALTHSWPAAWPSASVVASIGSSNHRSSAAASALTSFAGSQFRPGGRICTEPNSTISESTSFTTQTGGSAWAAPAATRAARPISSDVSPRALTPGKPGNRRWSGRPAFCAR